MSKKIKLDPRNARIHDERNKSAVKKSLAELGAGRSIVVDADGVVIGGNAVYEQAQALGIPIKEIETKGDELIVVRRVDLKTDDPRRKALALADNQIGTLAGWDEVVLDELQTELLGEIEFDVMGFDEPVKPIDEGDVGELVDRAEELNEKWKVERGQIWEIPGNAGTHRVMCGDSTDAGDVGLLVQKKPDMLFADPPYGINLDTDYHSILGSKKAIGRGHIKGRSYSKVIRDDLEFNPTFLLQRFKSVREIFLWGADSYAKLLPRGGWFVWDKCVTKEGVVSKGAEKMIGSTFELCWSKQRHKRMIVRLFHRGFTSVDHTERMHPTQKPIQLAGWFIERFSDAGDVVLDPFLGSGTTVIAAEQEGRICYGMEIEPKYVAVVLERLSALGLEPVMSDG